LRFVAGMMLLAFVNTPVSADWQYTRWGMTKDEVIFASQGAAKAYSATDQDAGAYRVLATAPYTGLGFEFVSLFMFDWQTSALIGVKLNLNLATQCKSMLGALIGTYGNPLETTGVPVRTFTWRDYKNKNVVKARLIEPTYCQIIYSPIIETGPSGGL